MKSLSYEHFIEEINSGKILKAVFQINNYAHYNNCLIERETDIINNGKSTVHIVHIAVKLTKDSEHYFFLEEFDEKIKIFNMKRKGKFTLKQMWDRIEFISIDYATK